MFLRLLLDLAVCCQHVLRMSGDVVVRNRTVVQNPEFPNFVDAATTSNFTYTVENIADDICFIRLDFVVDEMTTSYDMTGARPPQEGDCFDRLTFT